MQSRVLSPVEHAHSAAKFHDNAVVPDGLADHWRESYVCETGKSMKALGLAAASEGLLLPHRQSNSLIPRRGSESYRLLTTTILDYCGTPAIRCAL